MAEPILLAGISMRMLAQLALRAGYDVVALDYFGDADLQAACSSVSLLRDFGGRYSPAALVEAASQIAAPAVVYGASLENHPQQVARLSDGRRRLGNSPQTLEQVRDHTRLKAALHAGGFRFPTTLAADETLAADSAGHWLVKPRRSGGGHGIRQWQGETLAAEELLQAQVAGTLGSASFAANGEDAVLLGLTRQLVGEPAFGAKAFRYCGNLLPLEAVRRQELLAELQAMAEHVTRTFGLVGLNGIDFVDDGAHVWLLEVNPRPTAALELIDAAYGLRVFDVHVRACGGALPQFDLGQKIATTPTFGKAIVYAKQNVTLGTTAGWATRGRRDIPHPGETIRRGHPICTLTAQGANAQECRTTLEQQAFELKTEIYARN